MSDREEFEALCAKIKEKQANSIGVEIKGREYFEKRPVSEDTFIWVAGPKIEEFHRLYGITVLSSSSSDDPNLTTFFFPKDRSDLATLFKLTFA